MEHKASSSGKGPLKNQLNQTEVTNLADEFNKAEYMEDIKLTKN
jgi:hypothetical protein